MNGIPLDTVSEVPQDQSLKISLDGGNLVVYREVEDEEQNRTYYKRVGSVSLTSSEQPMSGPSGHRRRSATGGRRSPGEAQRLLTSPGSPNSGPQSLGRGVDEASVRRRVRRQIRDQLIVQLREEEWSIRKIAHFLDEADVDDVSPPTVAKVLSEHRDTERDDS